MPTGIAIRTAVVDDVAKLTRVVVRSSLSNDGDRDLILAHAEVWLVYDDEHVRAGHTRAALVDGTIVGFATLLPGDVVIGSVRFVRVGDQLTLRYVMDMGDPNTDYAVHLFDGDTCTSLGKVGSFSTDAAGAGRTVSRRVNVAGRDRFYAAAIDLTTFVGIPHGSYAVDLP